MRIMHYHRTQKRFSDCRYKLPLPFDFYLLDYNICIEYHGIQHYEPRSKFGGEIEYEKTILRDTIKKEYCLKQNIPLLIISYNENVKDKLTLFFKSNILMATT